MKESARRKQNPPSPRRFRHWAFPVSIVGVYLILGILTPGRTMAACEAVGRVLLQAALPLFLAFVAMVLMNLYINPATITRFMGDRVGVRGVALSSLAGIISMGPIFAWYPFLESLREKGAADFYLANFLSSRAVKPVLLPLLITYFGWSFSIVFTAVVLAGALLVAAAVGLWAPGPEASRHGE